MSDKTLMQQRVAELREIERANNGVLLPESVVNRASNPDSALHSAFEWDNTEAARKYRLEQARQLIRVCVEYVPHIGQEVRAFVSLHTERYIDGQEGGYRHMPTLLRTDRGRADVLETALWELEAIQRKYEAVKELADVFAALAKVRKGRAA